MDLKARIQIWEGLDNFRQVLLDLLTHDISKINQTSLDRIFSGYGFKLKESRRNELIRAITEKQRSLDPNSELSQNLALELEKLKDLEREIIINRETKDFYYDFVFKASSGPMTNLSGFVKIINKKDARNRALLSWQSDKRDPILFLAELSPDVSGNPDKEQIFFHINLGGSDGMAILYEEPDSYRWTQCLKYDYPDLINAEFGSVAMNKTNREISLIDGNISAAVALSKAQEKTHQGITLFENNVALMQVYQKDLQGLDFNY